MTGKKVKRTWPIDVDCPKCIGKAGWGCVTLDGTWRSKFHKERSEKAREATKVNQAKKRKATIEAMATIEGYEDYPDPIRITAPLGHHLKIFISSRSHVCLVSVEADHDDR